VVSEEEDEFASASEGEDAPPLPVQIDDKSQKTATGKGAVTLDSREQEKESTFDKNVEQPLTASTPNAHTTSAGQQETSGWSSWGSWLSSAVSTATEAIVMGDVDSLYNQANTITTTIRHVAAEQVDRVYETLDPDFTNDNTIRESASNGQPSISSENHGSKDKVNQEVEGQTGDAIRDTAEVLLSTIDKTFDFASNVLGNAVLGGYNKLSTESAKLQEQIQVGRLSEQLQATRLIEPIGNLAER
ncbi:1771_t:CDS:2, partial [Paraglomus occultum]